MRRIDAHQHFWRLGRGDYGWLTPKLAPIYRDFSPGDLLPILKRHGIDGTVLVQAAPTEAETDFMLGLADEHDFILGVVGWVNFAALDAAERIARMAAHPKLEGLRPMIQDIADPEWMLSAELRPAYEALIAHGLVFDALVLPRHLDVLPRLLARHPDMRTVVDHSAKPAIAAGDFDDWAAGMSRIARESAAFCKLSGLVTEAGLDWSVATLRPYAEHILEAFGPERVIWGSDWPVCTLAASYDAWVEATDELLSGCTASARAAILGGNAARLYRL
ncbi:MAG: amidohydrolase family protein [Rhizobiaceae bacterium]|nr:amidohydrolase family protein [Rhizobiaceae bacterium]